MRVKGKRVLKNGVTAGYIRQEDGSWRWRFLSGPKKSRKRGGVKNNNNIKPIKIRTNKIPLARANTSGLQPIEPSQSFVSNLHNQQANARRNNNIKSIYTHPNNIPLATVNTSHLQQQQRVHGQSVVSNVHNPQQTEPIHQASMINRNTIPPSFVTGKNISNHRKGRGYLGRLYNSYVSSSNLPNTQHDLHGKDFIYTINNLKRIRTDINKDSRHLKKKGDLHAMNDLLNTSISKRYFIYFVAFLDSLPDDIKFAEGFLRISPQQSDLNNFKEKIDGELLEPHVIIEEVLEIEDLENRVRLYGSILKYLLSESVLNNPGHNFAQFKNVSERIEGNMTIAQNEHYKLGIEIRFFKNIMRKLIIPILRNTAELGGGRLDLLGISRMLGESILPSVANVNRGVLTIGNITGPMDIVNQRTSLLLEIIQRCLDGNVPEDCLVRETRTANVPQNANGQGGAARGGSRKRRKRK